MNTQHPECCPPGSHGRAASKYLDAKGQTYKWTLAGNEVDVYIVGPADAHTTVIAIGDLFSIHEGRIKGCCDFLAERGHRVVLPDFHKGDPVVMEDGFWAKLGVWQVAHPVTEVVEMVNDTFNKVRGEGKKVVTIGFCRGTWVQYRAMQAKIAMDGAICMHPSIVAEDMAGGDHSKLLAEQNCPVMVAAASNDVVWTKPGGEMEEVAKKLGFSEKSKFYDFVDMKHGWTCRGDIKDEKIARDVDLAFNYADDFIKSL